MKKFILPAVFLAAGLTVSISGCQNQALKETEESKIETAETLETAGSAAPSADQIEIGSTEGKTDGMVLYSSCPFLYEDMEWELQTFVQENMMVNGELAMDDGGHFLIQAVSGEDSYVLLDERIQLGMPEADVWIDQQEKLHIVLRDVRTARYRVTDFIYDSEKREFVGCDVLCGDGINYLGTTGR